MRRLGKVGLRILAGLGVLFLALITLVFAFRLPLAGWVLRNALADAGATDIKVTVTQLSPRHVGIKPLGFTKGGLQLKIESITLDRPEVFSGSLGRVRLEGVAAMLDLTAVQPPATLAKKAAEAPAKKAPPPEFSFEQIQIEGRVTLAFCDGSQVFTIDLNAKPVSRSRVAANAHVVGPGLAAAGHGEFDLTGESGELALDSFRLELKPWNDLLAAFVPGGAAGWAVDGTVTGDAHGKFEHGVITGAVALHLRDGAVHNEAKKASAGGITADLSLAALPADGQSHFHAEAALAAPGIAANARGEFDPAKESGEFALQEVRLELKPWNDFLLALAPAAAGFEFDGVVTGEAHGRMEKAALTGTATLRLRDGSLRNPATGVSAEGIVADLVFPNLQELVSAPHQSVRMGKAAIGTVTLQHGEIDLQIASEELVTVNAASVEAFGGRLSGEPFQLNPVSPTLRLVVQMTDVQAQQVLALFPDAPQGEGILTGRVPVSYEDGRLAFGEGRLGLKPGTTGRIRFQNPGLFTQAWSRWMPGRKLLEQIETGREAFLVNEATIELHPADMPARPARIRLVGVPAEHPRDGPFTFDFNINIPLETIVNLGLSQNMHFELK